jgi:hypothetical protein
VGDSIGSHRAELDQRRSVAYASHNVQQRKSDVHQRLDSGCYIQQFGKAGASVAMLRRFIAFACVLSLSLLVLLGGCAATLVAPPASTSTRTVLLLDHGRHTSLAMADANGDLWRYAYGDWRWYVEADRGLTPALGALLRDSRAALGRARLEGGTDRDSLQPQVGSLITAILPLQASAEAVDALHARLSAHFDASEHDPLWIASLQLHVVEHPRAYSLGHNSNHAVANWLAELGYQVKGSPSTGRWRLADPVTAQQR